jgi:D-alanyl-D-alanine carboxypeptidase (penicillin-binding protein 5/6)
MLRSLISLLLITGLASAPISSVIPTESFSEYDLLNVSPVPRKRLRATEPVIEARSALLMDLDTGILLYKKNPYEPMPMASLTKIMTAIIILESHRLDEVVTIEENYGNYKELGVRIWLHQYEKITVDNLLTALLVRSAGDAAMALAKYHSGSVEDFVGEMNEKAKELNLNSTSFANPIGLDDEQQYSNAFELAILTKYALHNNDFRRIIRLPRAIVTSTDGQIKHAFEGTNYLLSSYLDIRGVKTGTTDAAGESIINLARYPNQKEVISVIMDSPSRFQESKRLIDWGGRNYRW